MIEAVCDCQDLIRQLAQGDCRIPLDSATLSRVVGVQITKDGLKRMTVDVRIRDMDDLYTFLRFEWTDEGWAPLEPTL